MNHPLFQALGPSDFYDVVNGDFRIRCYALEWANYVHFPPPIPLSSVGPRDSFGPAYKRRGKSRFSKF